MTKSTTIAIAEFIGSPFAVATEDALRLHREIVRLLADGQNIVLSFDGIEMLTSSFTNPAIGRLYEHFEPAVIDHRLRFTGISSEDQDGIERAKDRGQAFFANPDLFETLLDTHAAV